LDGQRRQLLTSRSQLKKDRAAYSEWQLIIGSFFQLLTMCILTAAFAKVPHFDVMRALFALVGWTWQRCSRYVLKKEDLLSLKGKAIIGFRMMLENFNCLCTLFFIANPCSGINQPNTSFSISFVRSSVFITVSLVHFLSVVIFNINIPELPAIKYGGHNGIGWRQAIVKAISNLFFPAVGRDWHEPQGRYGTDDSRKTSEEIKRDWKRKLCEYAVVSGLYCIRNIVLMYPALECTYNNGYHAILALPIGLLFSCLLQMFLFKQYNEENHPWKRLLKTEHGSNQPEKNKESTKLRISLNSITELLLVDPQIQNTLGLSGSPLELSPEVSQEINHLYHAGTARFSNLYHEMVAKKLRQSKMQEIAETREEGNGELVLTLTEKEQIDREIEIAEEDRREKHRNMDLLEYSLLVREYAEEVGKTDKEVVREIIKYVLENAGSRFQLTDVQIDEILRRGERLIPLFLLLTIPKEKIREIEEPSLD
jgi:hypothetical protein